MAARGQITLRRGVEFPRRRVSDMTKLGESCARVLSALGIGILWGFVVLVLGSIVFGVFAWWASRSGGEAPGEGFGYLWVLWFSGVGGCLGFLFSVASRSRG